MQYKEFNSTESKVSAIIICNPPDPLTGNTAIAYHYVNNSKRYGVQGFVSFAKKFHTAQYINFYSRANRAYLGRIYLNQPT